MFSEHISERSKSKGFIEDNPVFDHWSILFSAKGNIPVKPLQHQMTCPTTLLFQYGWKIPMVQCDKWNKAKFVAFLDDPVIKFKSFFVGLACSVGKNP